MKSNEYKLIKVLGDPNGCFLRSFVIISAKGYANCGSARSRQATPEASATIQFTFQARIVCLFALPLLISCIFDPSDNVRIYKNIRYYEVAVWYDNF